jgi:ABC-type Na+ efflux pump permease subunit
MILRNLFLCNEQRSPAKMVPVAMMLITLGMMILMIGVAWPRLSAVAHVGTDWSDFWRGFMVGFAIVMETAGLVIALKAAVAARAKKL